MNHYAWPSDSIPPEGREVVVTMADNTSCLAMYNNGKWFVGVADDPIDAELQGSVISWRFCDTGE